MFALFNLLGFSRRYLLSQGNLSTTNLLWFVRVMYYAWQQELKGTA